MILLALLSGCATALGEEPERFDVHAAMRKAPSSGCTLCHEDDRVALQVEPFETCHGCHLKTRHTGMSEHLGPLEEPWLQRARQAGLDLDGDEVGCLTCHDAHPEGSVDHRPVLERSPAMPPSWQAFVFGEQPVVEPSDMLLRPQGGLCESCHGAGGER